MPGSNIDSQQDRLLLADFLKKVRKSTGLTQREVAQKSGLSHTYIAQLETNRKTRLRLPTIVQLAEGYGVSIEAMSHAADVKFPNVDERRLMDRLDWAFDSVCNDPTVPFSKAVRERCKEDAILKAYIVGIYISNEKRHLLKPEEWQAIVAYVEQNLLTKQSVSSPMTPDPNRPRPRIVTATDSTATDSNIPRRRIQVSPIQENPWVTENTESE